MKNKNTQKSFKTFIYLSLIISLIFLIIIFIVKMIVNGYPINFYGLKKIHQEAPTLFLIDFLPLILFAISYNVEQRISSLINKIYNKLNNEQDKTKKTYQFIEQLRQGNTNIVFETDEQEDKLNNSLNNLRDELIRSKKDDKIRQKEEAQRHWLSEGLAKFGAILRENLDNLQKLSENITSNITKYLNAKQSGFFIIKEEKGEKYFEMSAYFAYDRKKFADKKILWGEGLIGACALEKKTIFLTETSHDFVDITSGLGKANPRSIIIVPLKDDEDEVHGVLELASFNIFEEFERDFIEQVAESIASTLANIKINMRTAELLKESQKQAEIMAQQEEIMKRNVDELKATQIEAAKQGEEFRSFTNSVNHTLIRAEYNVNGILTYANTKFLEMLNYEKSSELYEKNILSFISENDKEWFTNLWKRLSEGGKHYEGDMKHITKDGEEVWTMATYVSIRDHDNIPKKILFLGIDRTEDKKINIDFQGQIEALNRSTIKATFSPKGNIIDMNDLFLTTLKIIQTDLKAKTIYDLLDTQEQDRFKIIWQSIVNGKASEEKQKFISKSHEQIWIRGTYTVVLDLYNKPSKIVFIGYNITKQIEIESKNKEQNLILKKQEKELQKSKINLAKKLQETTKKVQNQYKEIELVKILNDKTLEGMLDAIVTINQDNYITFFNKAAEAIWNINRNIVIGKKIDYINPPDFEKQKEDDGVEYIGKFFSKEGKSLIGRRTEVFLYDKKGNRKNVLVTMSEANFENRYNLTAFIQTIEIEFF